MRIPGLLFVLTCFALGVSWLAIADWRGAIAVAWVALITVAIGLLLLLENKPAPPSSGTVAQGEESDSIRVMRDAARQMMTTAVALITLTLTFRRDLVPQAGSIAAEWLVETAWIGLGISALLGFFFQFSVSGALADGESPSLASPQLRGILLAQTLLFFGCVVVFVVFGFVNFT
ncbi:MAG: hypothetical protein AAF567_10000 [Actinomycetota bacterium]